MGGKIPQTFIDELLTRVDIIDVIDSRVPLKKKGKDYMACCPFHTEKSASFSVSQDKQFYYCFGCGATGSALGFLMDYEHMGFVESIEALAAQVGLEVPREVGEASERRVSYEPLYDTLEQASKFYRDQLRHHPHAQRAIDYLRDRGLSGEIVTAFGIGFAPPGWDNLIKHVGDNPDKQQSLTASGMVVDKGDKRYDRFRDRIMIPILDRRGRPIAFGGRVLSPDDDAHDARDGGGRATHGAVAEGSANAARGQVPSGYRTPEATQPKYLNSPETPVFHKGRELYGLYQARKALRELPRLLVVEGYMDVITLAQYGIRYAVATLGTATTTEHLEQLFRTANEVVFCFDGDRAGRAAAWRALENTLPVIREGRQARFLFLPDGEDPDTYVRKAGREALEADISQATPFSQFLLENLSRQADIQTPEGRAKLVKLAQPLFSKLSPGVYRSMLTDQLAKLAKMDVDKLEAYLDQPKDAAATPARPIRRVIDKRESKTLLGTVIQLILQRPSLVKLAGDMQRFKAINGIAVFSELIEIYVNNPSITTAAILERWRDNEAVYQRLVKLAKAPLPESDAGLEQEFSDALSCLETLAHAESSKEQLRQTESKPFSEISHEEKVKYIENMRKSSLNSRLDDAG